MLSNSFENQDTRRILYLANLSIKVYKLKIALYLLPQWSEVYFFEVKPELYHEIFYHDFLRFDKEPPVYLKMQHFLQQIGIQCLHLERGSNQDFGFKLPPNVTDFVLE